MITSAQQLHVWFTRYTAQANESRAISHVARCGFTDERGCHSCPGKLGWLASGNYVTSQDPWMVSGEHLRGVRPPRPIHGWRMYELSQFVPPPAEPSPEPPPDRPPHLLLPVQFRLGGRDPVRWTTKGHAPRQPLLVSSIPASGRVEFTRHAERVERTVGIAHRTADPDRTVAISALPERDGRGRIVSPPRALELGPAMLPIHIECPHGHLNVITGGDLPPVEP